jgi:type II secretory pathway component GspD/PulD (secretin)
VELLAMSQQSESTYGARLPSSFSLSWLGNTGFLNASTLPSTITGLLTFGGGVTMMGLGITNAAFFASMTQGSTRSMSKAELRSMDGQPAQVHIGDRYPIITLGYYGGPPDPKLKTYTPPPNIQFEDLGIVIKLTPKVHNSEEVSLDIEAEYKALAGSSANQIPVISNRKFKSIVRLKFGELAVMAGLVGQSTSRTDGGIPFLIKLPGLHEQTTVRNDNEILLTLRPFLLTVPPSEGVTAAVWSGTETRPLSLIQ